MSSEQLTFDLPSKPALGRDDFFVSPSNAVALATLEDHAHWPLGKLILSGPTGAGKTHLTNVWAAQTGAAIVQADQIDPTLQDTFVAVEDVPKIASDAQAQEALFHLHNAILARGGRLLMTGAGAPSAWPITLPDLASRLQGTNVAHLGPPDDALLTAVLVKLFNDRQLSPTPPLLTYLIRYMDRSFDSAATLVAEMDRRALAEGRKISRDLARDVLDSLPQG
ncbi:DnaA ATPase domain-containing protein [Nereida sp. MMG025]|uniref:DnaA ATPase domain-containing protein n=1 Tax=Nereida sp. MMG025 TaxID=2909981 RepID=UPI001F40EBC5|nr:DnaA/Hda family protein [Nereida sp. MMG025]MCF6443904.1 DnaA/Hda family protein [Nereida sp. MMG025]